MKPDFTSNISGNHYIAPDDFKSGMRDGELREMAIDRIYDTFIDEEDLRICDETTQKIFDSLEPGTYSSRQFLAEFGSGLGGGKPGGGRPEYVRQMVEGSLRRLRTDRIDLYQMHQPDASTPIADTLGALGARRRGIWL